jgi:hypothetical protein
MTDFSISRHVNPVQLPLISTAQTYSYPKEAGKAPIVRYFPLDAILTRAWTTDAHTTAYSVPAWPYRLSRDAVQFEGGVAMVLFITDIDGPNHIASDEWWLGELTKLDAMRREYPGAFIFRTRGGYRPVYMLPVPRILCSEVDVQAWKADYLSWIAALRVRFDIQADPSCQDWQRLYRVPHATRTPHGRPEAREVLGNPYQIGAWTCEPTNHERELAQTLARKPSKRAPQEHRHETAVYGGDGVLFYAFKARGWLGEAIESGKWSVKCPWDDQHTKGAALDTSTVLFAPGVGDTLGWLHCSHNHCQQRDIRDVLKLFSDDELQRAKRETGVMTHTVPITRHVRMYKPHFGLRVKGVRHAS